MGRWAIWVMLACGAFLFSATAQGQSVVPPVANILASTPPEPHQGGDAAVNRPEILHLLVGRSMVLSSPLPIRRVSVADANIADVAALSPTQILVSGKSPGGVSIVLWGESESSQAYELYVDVDVLGLNQRIRQTYPNEDIRVEASKDVVMLLGQASSKDEADRIYQSILAIAPKALNLLQTPPPPPEGQILLEVKFAEVDRAAISQFGFNFISLPGGSNTTLGVTGTQQFGPVQLQQSGSSTGTSSSGNSLSQPNISLSDILNIFVFRPDLNLGATIKALQDKNLLQILAEPNLLTESGKEANFLAGGEFPIPVVQGGAVGSAPTVTIVFKKFGVSLDFLPELSSDGMVHLKVSPEVSALDFTNAVTVSGFFIPAISTRRVETQVELRDGQSFAIAGLVDDRVTEVMNRIPYLSNIPLLGQIFRSHSTTKSNTELLVLVTPRIVNPIPAGAPLPRINFPEPFLQLEAPKGRQEPPIKK
ncbi:MAG: type II and III secretion system protein family protein [Candidatus Acidiferrales bacterium]